MAERRQGGGVGVELEHAIGFNGGLPQGVHVLAANVPVPGGGAPGGADARYFVSTGACAVVNSMTDPHDQFFYRGHAGAITAMTLSPSVSAAEEKSLVCARAHTQRGPD